MKKCSIITAIYNSNKTLPRFLIPLSAQTERDFELIIIDDGSEENPLPIIHEYQKYFKHEIKYLKQERKGIRKTMALNRGILISETDYLLFIDQDCLAAPNWVEIHLHEREPGYYLIGRRVSFREKMTPYLTEDFIAKSNFYRINLFSIYHALMCNIKHIEQFLVVKNKFLRWLLHLKGTYYLIGCNFSCWKEDLYKVNGWDNNFIGVGKDDVELDNRLRKIGLVPKSVKFLANVFHIYHPGRKNDDWKEYYENLCKDPDYKYAKNGLRELL